MKGAARRYVRTEGEKVELDRGKIAEDARYDGKWIIRTNTDLPAEEVALTYKGLWKVEEAFRTLKTPLELRPIYHWTKPRVRAHVCVCFLAFLFEVELRRRFGVRVSYWEVLQDLRQVKAVHLEVKGKPYLARTELSGHACQVFRAAGVVPPPWASEYVCRIAPKF